MDPKKLAKMKFTAEEATLLRVLLPASLGGPVTGLEVEGLTPFRLRCTVNALDRKGILRVQDRFDHETIERIVTWTWRRDVDKAAIQAKLDEKPAAPVVLAPWLAVALQWYTGKAQENAREGLELLQKSIELGSWIPGASRRVYSVLSKCNVARKVSEEVGAALDSLRAPGAKAYALGPGWQVMHLLRYGGITGTPDIDMAALRAMAKTKEQRAALDEVGPFVAHFRPIGEAMRKLDATRPIPVFTFLGVSPTVTKTLTDAGLDLNLSTIRVCPMRCEMVEDPPGKFRPVYVLDWPEGTKHNRSRFAQGDSHCHACGHAIKNGFNWVPLLIDSKAGVPHSLWVGRDCAKSVFGIDMQGELEVRR